MVLVFPHLFHKNYVGLSLWPFIIVKHRELRKDRVLLNHERIHLRQQREMLILPFYLWYFVEWALRTLWYRDSYMAYRNIGFEREAYAHEGDLDYPARRKAFGFIAYL